MPLKKIVRSSLWITVFVVLFVVFTNIWVVLSTRGKVYQIEDVPKNEVALVLGTSKRTISGGENRYFRERMNAAASLHRQESIRHILVSGDNGSRYYNEPIDMLQALGDLQIPDTVISLDYAGFRTFDSVVRCKEVFSLNEVTIVTQRFHCYRSLFLAERVGIEAIAVAADVNSSISPSLALREILARTVAVLDIYVLKRQPKYLGEKVELNIL